MPAAKTIMVGASGKFADIDPIAILKAGVRVVRHHKLGWLREDLIADGSIDGSKEAVYTRIFTDFQAQQIHIRAQRDILGDDFNPLHVMPGRDGEGRFSFTKNVDVPKNYLSQAYLLHAYDVSESTFHRLRARHGAPLEKQIPHNKNKSVLLDPEYAATHFTQRFFYVKDQMKKWLRTNPQATAQRKAVARKRWRAEWDKQKHNDAGFGAVYDKKARDHEARQAGAKGELKDILNRNGRRSYGSLEKAVNNWCCKNTIMRYLYLKSFEDYITYSQNVRLLLSEGNRIKQVAFSDRIPAITS
jgi:hypothetical protein